MKKLKLALSLSAFCFGIAMMVFGVFASSTIVYNISGQINYEINEALIDMTTNIYYSERLSTDTLTTAQIESKISECNMLTCDITSTDPTGVTKSSYSYNYNSFTGEGDGPVYTLPKLSFTNSTQVYYIIVRIDNLVASGTAGNVWANATTTCGDNLVTYVSAKLPEITKGNAQNLVLVVGAKEIAEFDYQNYSFSISINIGAMPITATVDGETISTTYGTTWATFVSANSTKYSLDNSGCVLKGGEQLYYGSNKISSTSTIIDGAVYGTTVYGVVLADDTNKQFYMNLGTYNDSPIRWNMVSADGTTKYESTNYATDKANSSFISSLKGKAIFLQQSVSGGTVAFDAASTDYPNGYNNYYESDIRTNINTLSSWNLTESDVSSLISKRNIKGIDAYGLKGSNIYTGTTNDYFWLLSDDEINTFLGTTNDDTKWVPDGYTSGVAFWRRTPVHNGTDFIVGNISSDGSLGRGYAYHSDVSRVRAAFQLA